MVQIDRTSSITCTSRTNKYGAWKTEQLDFIHKTEIKSQNHFPLNTQIDDGGMFWLDKIHHSGESASVSSTNISGQIITQLPSGISLSPEEPVSESEANAFGTTAIARTEPLNPAMDLTVSLGELAIDGLPAVTGAATMRERAQIARSAGSEYLNVEFGWLPLLSDVQSFARMVKESDDILRQYRKDSGVKIRRRYEEPPTNRVEVTTHSNFLPWPSNVNTFGSGTLIRKWGRRRWFSGAFRYHIPTSTTQVDKFHTWARQADILLGASLTPEDLWNLAPWSWAVDWFSNVGDVMHNVSALGKDGLVLQYGYSMGHAFADYQAYASFTIQGKTYPTNRRWLLDYKRRFPATPYGFGVDMSKLSPRQISVLVALGLSRT